MNSSSVQTSVAISGGALGASGIIDFVNWLLSLIQIPVMQPGAGEGMIAVAVIIYHLFAGVKAPGGLSLEDIKSSLAADIQSAAASAVAASKTAQVLFAIVVLGAMQACTNTQTGQPWTPAQVAYFEISAAKTAEGIALKVVQDACMSPQVIAGARAAGQAVAAGVQANVPILISGAATPAQIQAAGLSATIPLLNNLGSIIMSSAVPGCQLDPRVVALTGTIDVLQTLPELIGTVVALNNGYVPAQADIDTAMAGLLASVAALSPAR